MKHITLLLITGLVAGACSSPKYTYNFDHYDYNSGKEQTVAQNNTPSPVQENANPFIIQPEAIVASAEITPSANLQNEEQLRATRASVVQKIKSMSRQEQKELKKELKAELKKYSKAKGSVDSGASIEASKAMDHDLKLAAIFGAVGLVLTLFGGVSSVFWVLGVIAFVIGVVFLIKWLSRQ
jgi:hypothetical protein